MKYQTGSRLQEPASHHPAAGAGPAEEDGVQLLVLPGDGTGPELGTAGPADVAARVRAAA